MAISVEQLLDKIADELILDESGVINPIVVNDNQKTIRNGTIQLGRGENDRLILYQKDVEANEKDLLFTTTTDEGEEISKLQELASRITDIDNVVVSISNISNIEEEPVYSIVLESLIDGIIGDEGNIDFIVDSNTNPLNVSQFVTLGKKQSVINITKANEFLDTNIYELLPDADTRQARITRFFNELNALLPPVAPDFDKFNSLGEEVPDQRVDRDENNNWIGTEQYSQDNSISYAQDNQDGNIDEEDAFLHRLKFGSVPANDTNSSKTIEEIYRRVEPFLKDILEDDASPEDGRQVYINQSSGYLQFRNLNQGIIVRNTNEKFVKGLNPDNPTYLNIDGTGGFTITMWVRFLDKSSEGTLFNFGNPTRNTNPFGFKLETYVINSTDTYEEGVVDTYGDYVTTQNIRTKDTNQLFFTNSNTERFVQLVVYDNQYTHLPTNNKHNIRDSHTGMSWSGGYNRQVNITEEDSSFAGKFTTTRIPEDFNEWYFICASFNPTINEDGSFNITGPNGEVYDKEPNFWMNHINLDGTFTNKSDYGNKCKVEIISKSDLLRARGYKV